MSLLEKLQKAGSIKAVPLAESSVFNSKDIIPTQLPILNTAFSGKLDGGFTTGITIFAGESKTFKTMLGLYCMKAYMDKYPEAIVLFYDSEFGTPPAYLDAFKIDTSRVLHIPIEHVEAMKFDVVKRLEQIKKGDKVYLFVDSLGNLASKKEVEDALKENSAADMTRAKAIRSFLRIITPHISMKDIPCVIINHVYQTQELYSTTVIPGGTAVTYAANQIFVISKTLIKDKKTNEILGYKFTINVHKSRFVKEKSKLPFEVSNEDFILEWSGLFDIALKLGYIKETAQGWYTLDGTTKFQRKKTENMEFWKPILADQEFRNSVEQLYKIGGTISDVDAPEADE